MKAGFIGVGEMGAPMAINLAGVCDVLAFCHTDTDQHSLTGSDVVVTNQLQQLAECRIILLCLPDARVVNEVLFGQHGLVQHLRAGTIVVDTSTTEYGNTLSISAQLNADGIAFIDAPVSGMRARAENGTLTMMCGGDQNHIEEVMPYLESMASKVIHMGQVGSGQLTKLINQLLFDINAAALAELLPMSVKLGLSPEKIADVVNSGTGRSYASEFFIPHILKEDFSNGYPMQSAYKDLVSGSEISAKHKIPLPVLTAAMATYQSALLAGHGAKDKGGMICIFEDLLGVKFRADDAQ